MTIISLEYFLASNNNHNDFLSGFYEPGRRCAKYFPTIIAFCPHRSLKRLGIILFSFYKWGNKDSVRLIILPRVPGLVAELGFKFGSDSNTYFLNSGYSTPMIQDHILSSHGAYSLHHPFWNHRHFLMILKTLFYINIHSYLTVSLMSDCN